MSIAVLDQPKVKRNNRILCSLRRKRRKEEGFKIDPVNLWNEWVECHRYFYGLRSKGYPRDNSGKFVKRWD